MAHRLYGRHLKAAPLLTLPIMIWSVVFGVIQTLIWPRFQVPNDWSSLWLAGQLLKTGHKGNIYDYNDKDFSVIGAGAWEEQVRQLNQQWDGMMLTGHPFVHTPGVAYFTSYLSDVITFEQSVAVMTFASGIALCVLLAAAYYLWFKEPIPLTYLAIGSMVFSVTEPAQFSFYYGQTSLLIYGGLVFGITAAKRFPVWAGVSIGAVAVVKLSPLALIVLLFFFQGRRLAASIGLVTAGAGFGLSYLAGGPELWSTWLAAMNRVSSHAIVSMTNISFSSAYLYDLYDASISGGLIIDNPPAPAVLVPLIFCLIVAGATYVAVVHRQAQAFPMLMSMAVIVAMLYPTIVWYHYLVTVVLLVMGILSMSVPASWKSMFFAVTCVFYFTPFTGLRDPLHAASLFVTAGMAVVLLVLYCREPHLRKYDEDTPLSAQRQPLLRKMFNLH